MSDQEGAKKKRPWLRVLRMGCLGYLVLCVMLFFYYKACTPDPVTPPAPVNAVVPAHVPAPVSSPDSMPMATAPRQVVVPPVDTVAERTVEREVSPPAHESAEVIVYTTSTGDHYHTDGCSSLRKSRYATTLSKAKAAGYERCHRCYPPQ